MAVYAVGDVQGCLDSLECLLQRVGFDPARDRLWSVGDLVNRGPRSLDTLRFFMGLGDSATVVLGNHDLHLLALMEGIKALKSKDESLREVLDASDRDTIREWLRQLPLLHYDAGLNVAMSHAGLLPTWDLDQAQGLARELESVLRGDGLVEFLRHMYGNQPDCWSDELEGYDRLRVITNCFTRMRFCKADGTLDLVSKETAQSDVPGYLPWFEHRQHRRGSERWLFGHWAALEGKVGVPGVHGLDTGCVWGGRMTLMRVGDGQLFSCECEPSMQTANQA